MDFATSAKVQFIRPDEERNIQEDKSGLRPLCLSLHGSRPKCLLHTR